MDDEVTRARLATAPPGGASRLQSAGGHPALSAQERNLLAERIARTDGVTLAEALTHIDEFMACDLTGR
jgi:hypothetical protein